jgi:hypothetical protein
MFSGLDEAMRLDTDLIRLVLLEVERRDVGDDEYMELEIAGHEYQAINYHNRIMREAGLIETAKIPDTEPGAPMHYLPYRLTWSGHQFLASIRDEGVWKEVRTRIAKVGGGVMIEVIKAVARRRGEETPRSDVAVGCHDISRDARPW